VLDPIDAHNRDLLCCVPISTCHSAHYESVCPNGWKLTPISILVIPLRGRYSGKRCTCSSKVMALLNPGGPRPLEGLSDLPWSLSRRMKNLAGHSDSMQLVIGAISRR
jgi:hypothetical protein